MKDFRQDREVNATQVKGVLYRGDAKTKYTKENNPTKGFYRGAYPEELAVMLQMNNPEAAQFMVKAIDFDTEAPTAMPDVDNVEKLTKFGISPERHGAYEKLWNYATYGGVLANAMVWLYL